MYRPTSKWNDVISEREIQKLVNATCQHKSCRERIITNNLASGLPMQSFPSVELSTGTSTRPGASAVTDLEQIKKLNVLPGLYNMGNTCFANSVLQCLVHTRVFREYCRLSKHSKGCFSDISKLQMVEQIEEFPAEKLERIPEL